LTDPVEQGPSSFFFTQEYFQRVREVLVPGGVAVVQAGPVSPAEIRLHARVVATLRTVFAHVHPYASFAPTYGRPWGFALASTAPLVPRLTADRVGRLLTEQTTGGLRFLDGGVLLGLLQTPVFVRRALEAEKRILTQDRPPAAVGSAAWEEAT
jgi:spermidine synthase